MYASLRTAEARTNRVIDAEQREDDAAQDLSGDSDGDTDADTDGADEEEGSDSDGNEGDEGEEEEEEEDDGKESGARTVVVKADSGEYVVLFLQRNLCCAGFEPLFRML